MDHPQFLLTKALSLGNGRIEIGFADGFTGEVDLGEVASRYPSLARLGASDVVENVAMDEWKRGVVFAGKDELGLASDNLRAMAIEQAGGFSHQQVITWMSHHGMSLDAAADALDISRRILAYYRSGARLVPRTVGLAMLGWEVCSGTTPAFVRYRELGSP